MPETSKSQDKDHQTSLTIRNLMALKSVLKSQYFISQNNNECIVNIWWRLRADRPWGGWGWPAGSEDVRGPVCWGETCCLRRVRRTWDWCLSQQHSCGPNSAPFSRPEYHHLYCFHLRRRTPPEPGRLLKSTTTISRVTWMSEQVHYYTILLIYLLMINALQQSSLVEHSP